MNLPATLLTAAILAPLTVPLHAAPNTFNTALPVAQNEFIWREQAIFRSLSDNGPLQRDVTVNALLNVLGYGVTSRLAVFVAVPYFFDRELNFSTPTGRALRQTDGIGDTTVFARYNLYRKDFKGATFRVAPVAGLTVPTGDDNQRDAQGRIPRSLQPGDGSWDVFTGVVATYQSLQYQLDSQLLYRENTGHDGFAVGDQVRLDASFQYRIWPWKLDSGTPGFVYALLESNLLHNQRNLNSGVADNNSGGTQWLLAPGLQYVSRRWIVEGTIQLPIASNPHGNAIQDDYIVRAGFRLNF